MTTSLKPDKVYSTILLIRTSTKSYVSKENPHKNPYLTTVSYTRKSQRVDYDSFTFHCLDNCREGDYHILSRSTRGTVITIIVRKIEIDKITHVRR